MSNQTTSNHPAFGAGVYAYDTQPKNFAATLCLTGDLVKHLESTSYLDRFERFAKEMRALRLDADYEWHALLAKTTNREQRASLFFARAAIESGTVLCHPDDARRLETFDTPLMRIIVEALDKQGRKLEVIENAWAKPGEIRAMPKTKPINEMWRKMHRGVL